jgi:uncharacterized protein (TIGR02266 family)
MVDERRSARRARLSGVRVAFESASGEVHEADVADLSRDGLFIRSASPVAVGKRLSLEIKVAGEAGPWAALGRILWVRATAEGDDRPAGMAVKFIDVDDVVVAAIDRLIEARERTEPGLGEGRAAPPPREKPMRERTMLGVGGFAVPAPAAPVAAPAASPPASPKADVLPLPETPAVPFVPSRERTVLGVGRDSLGADPREPSVAIDLVAKKPHSAPAPAQTPEAPAAGASFEPEPEPVASREPLALRDPAPEPEPRPAANPAVVSEPPAPARRSGAGWLLVLVLIAAAGACYAFREQLLPVWHQVVRTVMRNIR